VCAWWKKNRCVRGGLANIVRPQQVCPTCVRQKQASAIVPVPELCYVLVDTEAVGALFAQCLRAGTGQSETLLGLDGCQLVGVKQVSARHVMIRLSRYE
jgi:hypothetical protein